MGRKLNKLEILFYDIKDFFSEENMLYVILPKFNLAGKYWKTRYENLLEKYCKVIYEVTDGIMSYKEYRPEDILMLDDERINRIIYQDRLERLKDIMSEVKDYPTVLDVMIALDEYRQEAEDGCEFYKRGN